MKKTIAFLLGVATIIGSAMPALAADQNIEEPVLISTSVLNDKVNKKINNNLIIAGKVVNIGKAGVVINNGNVMVPLFITAMVKTIFYSEWHKE